MYYVNHTFRIATRLVVLLDDAKGVSVSTKEFYVQEPRYYTGEQGSIGDWIIAEGTEELSVSAGGIGDNVKASFKWTARYHGDAFASGMNLDIVPVGDVYYGRGSVPYTKTDEMDCGIYSVIRFAGYYIYMDMYADGGVLPTIPKNWTSFSTRNLQGPGRNITLMCVNFIICKKSLVAATGTAFAIYDYGDELFRVPTEYRGFGILPETTAEKTIQNERFVTVAKSDIDIPHPSAPYGALSFEIFVSQNRDSFGITFSFPDFNTAVSGTYDLLSKVFCFFTSSIVSIHANPKAVRFESFDHTKVSEWSNAGQDEYFSTNRIQFSETPAFVKVTSYGALFLEAEGPIDASVFPKLAFIGWNSNARMILPSIPAFAPLEEYDIFGADIVPNADGYDTGRVYITKPDSEIRNIDVLPEMFAEDFYDCGFLMFDIAEILPFLTLPYSTYDGTVFSYLKYLADDIKSDYEWWLEYGRHQVDDDGNIRWKTFMDRLEVYYGDGEYESWRRYKETMSAIVKQLSKCTPKYIKNTYVGNSGRLYEVPSNKFVLEELFCPDSTYGISYIFQSVPDAAPQGEYAKAVFLPLGADESTPSSPDYNLFHHGMYIPCTKRRKYLSTVKAVFGYDSGELFCNMAVLYLAVYNRKTKKLARVDTKPDGVDDPSRLTRLDGAEKYPHIDNNTRNEAEKEEGQRDDFGNSKYANGIIRKT